jgi:uncharacterized membrane protein YidH (DUF202 family)
MIFQWHTFLVIIGILFSLFGFFIYKDSIKHTLKNIRNKNENIRSTCNLEIILAWSIIWIVFICCTIFLILNFK